MYLDENNDQLDINNIKRQQHTISSRSDGVSDPLMSSDSGSDTRDMRNTISPAMPTIAPSIDRFTRWLGQNTHLISLRRQLPRLQVRRSDYPALSLKSWKDRIVSPVQSLVGSIQGKFQNNPLPGRQTDNIKWLSRRHTTRGQIINTEQAAPGGTTNRISPESFTGEKPQYNSSSIVSSAAGDTKERHSQPKGITIFENRGSANKSSRHGILPKSISNTQILVEQLGQHKAPPGYTQRQSITKEQVKPLTDSHQHHADTKSRLATPDSKQGEGLTVLPSPGDFNSQKNIASRTSRYTKDNRDTITKGDNYPNSGDNISERYVTDNLEQPEYTVQKDLSRPRRPNLIDLHGKSSSPTGTQKMLLNKQIYKSESYSGTPSLSPLNTKQITTDELAAKPTIAYTPHKITGEISRKTDLESGVAIPSVLPEPFSHTPSFSRLNAKEDRKDGLASKPPLTSTLHKGTEDTSSQTVFKPSSVIPAVIKESGKSRQRPGYTSTSLPASRLIQTKSIEHIKRLSSLPQMIKNTNNSYIQAYVPSPKQEISAKGNLPENSLQLSKVFHEVAANGGISVDRTHQKSDIPLSRSIPSLKTDGGAPSINQWYISKEGPEELSTETTNSSPRTREGSSLSNKDISQIKPSVSNTTTAVNLPGQLMQRSLNRSTDVSGKRFGTAPEKSPIPTSRVTTRDYHPVSTVTDNTNTTDSHQTNKERIFVPNRLSSIQGKAAPVQAFESGSGPSMIQMAYHKQRPTSDIYSPFTAGIESLQKEAIIADSIPTYLYRSPDENTVSTMPAENTETQSTEQPEQTGIDIDSIAQKVYQILKRQLTVERERRGVQF